MPTIHNSTTTHSLQGKAVLWVSSNNNTNVVEQKLTKPLINIGRDTSNDIAIDEDIISSYHFQIQESNGLYYLIHPSPLKGETSNGFSFQGKLYHGKEPFKHPLTNGDVFRIGDPSGSDGSMVSVTFNDGSGDISDILTLDNEVTLKQGTYHYWDAGGQRRTAQPSDSLVPPCLSRKGWTGIPYC